LNPCFDDVRLRVSADVLLEGTREQADRRGLFWMAPDVITFVITSPIMASVWKRSDSQYFTACFRDQAGRQRRSAVDREIRLLVAVQAKLSHRHPALNRATDDLRIDVRTVRPFHCTSRGSATFTDRSFILN
jgi:hypothetical protein